jgi:hypothetical protein
MHQKILTQRLLVLMARHHQKRKVYCLTAGLKGDKPGPEFSPQKGSKSTQIPGFQLNIAIY